MQRDLGSECGEKNFLVVLSYSGKNYHGWQVQANASSVQEIFQRALKRVIKEVPDVKGCSRTDSGAHANVYCVSFKTKRRIPCEGLVYALNSRLPADIAVKSCKIVPSEFHARYSCTGKQYVYKIWNEKIRNPFLDGYALHYRYPLDVELMNAAARAFVGSHDFTSFCTLDRREPRNMVRNVKKFEVVEKDGLVELKVEADGFLYNMVRITVGTLLRVSQGKIAASELPLIIGARNRKKAGPTAPACGLYLNEVFYGEERYK